MDLKELQLMDPYDFEELVAEIWEAEGFTTNVRQGSRDRGIDVEAVKDQYKVLIQAKRYSSGNKVGSQEVRKYATLYQQDQMANEVAIVTTSQFTSEAKKIATEQNVTIIDGKNTVEMLDDRNIYQSDVSTTDSDSPVASNTKNYTSTTTEIEDEDEDEFELSASTVDLFSAIYGLLGKGVGVAFKIYIGLIILMGIMLVFGMFLSDDVGFVPGTVAIIVFLATGLIVGKVAQMILSYSMFGISSYLSSEAENRREDQESDVDDVADSE
jgi:hypothetical protein